MTRRAVAPWFFAGLALAACSSSTSGENGDSLVVMGDAGSPASTVAAASLRDGSGDPAELLIGVYALYISPNADCSAAVQVQSYGTTASVKDFVAHPTLFSGDPDPGSYQCVAIKMSDVITAVPATTFGNCTAGTHYPGDIYRAGDSSWKDIDLNTIVGTGTDSTPADDRVLIVLTRDTAAAITRGFDGHQVIQLGSDLISPSHTTFYWHGEGSVIDQGGQCGVNPGHPSFD